MKGGKTLKRFHIQDASWCRDKCLAMPRCNAMNFEKKTKISRLLFLKLSSRDVVRSEPAWHTCLRISILLFVHDKKELVRTLFYVRGGGGVH